MTSEIVNLRRARKRRAREAALRDAAENRVRFGAPKEARSLQTALEGQQARRLEAHRRTAGEDDGAGT
jgi:hypothetical protein